MQDKFINCPYCNEKIQITPEDVKWGRIMCFNCNEVVVFEEDISKDVLPQFEQKDDLKTDTNSSFLVNNDAVTNDKKTINDYGNKSVLTTKTQKPLTQKTGAELKTESIDYNYLDKVLQIQSIRRMGLIAIIMCGILNPIAALICALIGENRGNRLSGVPNGLYASLEEAIRYNAIGKKVAIIMIVIEIICSVIGFFIYMEM